MYEHPISSYGPNARDTNKTEPKQGGFYKRNINKLKNFQAPNYSFFHIIYLWDNMTLSKYV